MTKELTTESGVRVVLVQVPKDADYFEISHQQLCCYERDSEIFNMEGKPIPLPVGNWQLKRFNEMSEEECVPLVPYGTSSVEHMVEPKDLTGFVKSVDSYGRDLWTKVTSIFYKDFTKKPHHRSMSWTAHVATAKESLASLIRSHGYDPELTIVLTEKE